MRELSTLKNGLRVVSHHAPDAHSVALVLSVDVGARHETLEEGGLSHLLEHMAFKGTPDLNAQEIAEAFDRMGGQVNAYTSHEHTVYYAKVLKEYAEEALHLLCDIVVRATLDEAELAREKDVVLQEMAMHEDTPDDVIMDMFQACCFPNQPMGRSILGEAARVAAYSRADVAAYVAKHYVPNRMVIATAGAMPHAQACHIVGQAIQGAEGAPNQAPNAQYEGGVLVQQKALEQVQLMIGLPACSVRDTDYYPMQVLTTILGGGMSSRLFQEIREKRGLAYTVSAYLAAYADVGVLGMHAGTSAAQVPALLAAMHEVMAGMREGVSADELLRAKNQMKANIVMAQESFGAQAEWMARHVQLHGRVKTAEEILAAIEAVDAATITRLANRYLDSTRTAVSSLGPVGEATIHASALATAA